MQLMLNLDEICTDKYWPILNNLSDIFMIKGQKTFCVYPELKLKVVIINISNALMLSVKGYYSIAELYSKELFCSCS